MEKQSTLLIGSDHAGYALKTVIADLAKELGCQVVDCGTDNESSVDYSDFGIAVARKIASGDYEKGILICGTGLGMSMVANRFTGVRAALCNDLFCAIMSRRHNDANILVMGGRVIGTELAREITRVWLSTPFEGGRHEQRIAKFDQIA